MKNMKKFASILLALVLAMALTVPALAAENKTITINNSKDGHVYGAFQIFTGDVAKKTEGEGEAATTVEILSNVQWGSNISEENQKLIKAALKLNDTATAGDVATAIATQYAGRGADLADFLDDYITGDPVAKAEAPVNGAYTMSVPTGYYLIKDTSSVIGDDAKTDFILEIVGDASVSPKASDTPTPDKEVLDTNDSDSISDTDAWGDSADHDVGDTISYRLTATLPTSYTQYKRYKLEFHDTMDKGLTYNNDAKVYVVNGTNKTEITGLSTGTITSSTDDTTGKTTLTVTLDNLKADTFKSYGIVAGSKIVVEYTARLNENAVFKNNNEMYLVFSNDPNWDEGGTPPTGTSEKVINVVFTYKPTVNKIDAEKKPLTGAEFELYKWDENTENWVKLAAATKNDAGTSFSFEGIDDGVYKLVESQTPAGYNTVADILFGVKATHTTPDVDPTLTIHDITKNEETGEWVFSDGQKTDFTIVASAGTVSTDVVNVSGAQMPETGGIGTTIFYTLGGLMVVAAGVLLVTKRRMQSKG